MRDTAQDLEFLTNIRAGALKPAITTVILTYNEELHISRAIASARLVSRDIIVVDSYSTDRTVELAHAAGARVLQNTWTNHSRQFEWGLANSHIKTEWILRLDADEVIGADLAQRINEELPAVSADVAGVLFNRRHVFMGRWVKRGGRYPLRLLRLWRTGQGRVEDRWMDEHVVVWGGRTISMEGAFSDASLQNLTFFVAKHNDYASREAVEVLNQRYDLFDREVAAAESGKQARFKRAIKTRIYYRLPFGSGPLMYFIFRYFVQLGFLDGKTGLIYHFLQGFWYRFLVEAKVLEFDREIRHLDSREDQLAVLSRLTGFKL